MFGELPLDCVSSDPIHSKELADILEYSGMIRMHLSRFIHLFVYSYNNDKQIDFTLFSELIRKRILDSFGAERPSLEASLAELPLLLESYSNQLFQSVDKENKLMCDYYGKYQWSSLDVPEGKPALTLFKNKGAIAEDIGDNYELCMQTMVSSAFNGFYDYCKIHNVKPANLKHVDKKLFSDYVMVKLWTDNPELFIWFQPFFESHVPDCIDILSSLLWPE